MIVIYQKQLPNGEWETVSAPLDFEPSAIPKLLPYLKAYHGNICMRVIDENRNIVLSENQIN